MLDSPQHNTAPLNPIMMRLGPNTNIFAYMHIEVDQVAFNINALDDSLVITVKKFSDLRDLVKNALIPVIRNNSNLGALDATLDRMNLTVYLQNRLMGIIGPKANPVLKWVFHAYVSRVSKRFS